MENARAKMPREQRAKQFLPFAGVKGLDEALALREEVLGLDPEHLKAEDYFDLLNRQTEALMPGDELVLCLAEEPDRTRRVRVVCVDRENRLLICEDGKVPFDSIRSLETV